MGKMAQALRTSVETVFDTEKVEWVNLLEWTIRHRSELIPDRFFDLHEHRYLEQIYLDDSQEMVLFKAGQMGISEYLVSFALHACDIRKATTLYVFPTDGNVSDFSAARLGPAIEASDYLKSIVIDNTGKAGRRGSDKVTLKRIRNRFLYFRGAQVKPDGNAAQLKSVDGDVLILDELDEMDQRAPDIARKRLGHSRIAMVRIASTPTYHGMGIHAAYEDTNQHEWRVECQACRYEQTVSITNVVNDWDSLDRPTDWNDEDGRPFVACLKCGKELSPDVIMGQTYRADGRTRTAQWVAKYPDRQTAGYHVTKFMSPTLNLVDILAKLKQTSETARKEVYNQDLGLPYKPRGTGLTDTDLDGLRRDYGFGTLSGVQCYMGVDVGRVHNVIVRTKEDPETGERKLIHAEQAESFDRVINLIKQFNPVRVVIDALPETTKAEEVRDAFPKRKVWLAYYNNTVTGNKKDDPARWNAKDRYVNIDRTRMFDELYEIFFDGILTLPAFAREIADYYSQVKAPVRVLEKTRDGNSVARYVESSADHYAHAELYCAVAAKKKVVKATAGKLDY